MLLGAMQVGIPPIPPVPASGPPGKQITPSVLLNDEDEDEREGMEEDEGCEEALMADVAKAVPVAGRHKKQAVATTIGEHVDAQDIPSSGRRKPVRVKTSEGSGSDRKNR